MKEVVREFGAAVLAAIILLGIMNLLYQMDMKTEDGQMKKGLRNVLGSMFEIEIKAAEGEDPFEILEGDAFSRYEEEGCASIQIKNLYLVAGQTTSYEDCIEVMGYEAAKGSLEITDLIDEKGKHITELYDNDLKQLTLKEPGVYQVMLAASAPGCRKSYAMFPLLCNPN